MLILQSRPLSIVLDAVVEALNEAGISDYSTEQVESFVNKIVQMLLQFGVLHPDLTVTTIANLEGLAAAHYPELCFAWLQSFDPNYTPVGTAAFNSGVHRVVRINCPVDVSVFDTEGTLVAAIINGQLQNTPGSSIVSYINEQEEKLVYLPTDAGYRVELMAAGTGTMNFAIQEFSEAAGGVNRLLHFCNLPLAKGAVYTCTIPAIAESELSGADRYATNLAILEKAGVEDQEILVCTGSGFADSLSASATGLPVLLSGQGLTPAQKEFLAETSGKFIIIGGTGAVDVKLEAELTTFGAVERLSGADR